jgi:3-keto-disaccharide hydrolase
MPVEDKFRIACGAILFAVFIITGCSGSKLKEAAPEPAAPLQTVGKEFVYNFDGDAINKMPGRFHSGLTGQGTEGEWVVKADPGAPSPPNVFAQTSSDSTNYRFPLAIADDGIFKDPELSVRFKPISGKEDQAAGLAFRLKDANNYYIVRANALENNVVLYKVENGKRTDLPLRGEGRTYGKKANVPSGQWSTLKVIVAGNLFEVYLNDEKLYEVEDETFMDAGKIGLWTKADSVTYFDDLRVTAR